MSVKRGDSVTVDIHIVGFPQPAVTWYKNSVVVETTERFTTETTRETSQLVISKALMEDAGNYVVVVENELARDELQISITVIGTLYIPHLKTMNSSFDYLPSES